MTLLHYKKSQHCWLTRICIAQCKSSAEKPGPKVEKPGSRRSEVSEFLEPTSHSEVYFHGPGLVRHMTSSCTDADQSSFKLIPHNFALIYKHLEI